MYLNKFAEDIYLFEYLDKKYIIK